MKHKPAFFRPLKGGSLKTKLLFVYFLLVVLPLGFFTVYSYIRVWNVMRRQTLTAAQNAFDTAFLSVRQAFGKLDEVLDILVLDPIVYHMASNNPDDYTYISRLEDSDSPLSIYATFPAFRVSGCMRTMTICTPPGATTLSSCGRCRTATGIPLFPHKTAGCGLLPPIFQTSLPGSRHGFPPCR